MSTILKKTPILLLSFAIIFMAAGCKNKSGSGQSKSALSVEIDKGEVSINGKSLKKTWTIQQFNDILGAADDVADLANTIHTHDDLGLIIYQKPGKTIAHDFNLYWGYEDHDWVPEKLFTGNLTMDGVSISGKHTWDDLKNKWPKYDWKEGYAANSIRIALPGDGYLWLFFTNPGGKLKYVSVGHTPK